MNFKKVFKFYKIFYVKATEIYKFLNLLVDFWLTNPDILVFQLPIEMLFRILR